MSNLQPGPLLSCHRGVTTAYAAAAAYAARSARFVSSSFHLVLDRPGAKIKTLPIRRRRRADRERAGQLGRPTHGEITTGAPGAT